MAGLVPAIHSAPIPANPKLFRRLDDVAECVCIRLADRDKPGYDGDGFLSQRPFPAQPPTPQPNPETPCAPMK
jgi:hypothetical protein